MDNPAMMRVGRNETNGNISPSAAVVARRPEPPKTETQGGVTTLGLSILTLLVVQNTAVILLTRYTKLPGHDHYDNKTVVLLQEAIKCFISAIVVQVTEPTGFVGEVKEKVCTDLPNFALLGVPSILYLFQNVSIYIALENLDPAVFQVVYQLKLLIAAVVSRIVFRDRLVPIRRWVALVILFVGIALASIPEDEKDPAKAFEKKTTAPSSNWYGVIVCVGAAIASGLSGVFMEYALKGGSQSLWLKNFQLGGYSVAFAYVACMNSGGASLDGVYGSVCGVIMLQAVGGLIVAAVLKYCDVILKNFSTSISTILSGIFSSYLFGFHPSSYFLIGAALVIYATYLYNKPTPPPTPARSPSSPTTRYASENGREDAIELEPLKPI
jgi:UDP-galactose transporter